MNNTFFYNPDFELPKTGVYNPPLNRNFIGIIVKNIDNAKMYKIMGREGKVFKAISHQTGVDYIFWLKNEGIIAVWGYNELLPNAVFRIQERINLILNNYDDNFPPI
jgi:hypothetical protein